MKKFLTARWHNLVMANDVLEPELLQTGLPKGTSLDFHDRSLFVSLVGFMFLDTKVVGIPVPFHINFEEVNLRFYVKRETKDEVRRGVCFVKEIVPRFMITTVARILYDESYETWTMIHTEKNKELTYSWEKNGLKNRLLVEIAKNLGVPDEGSEGEFIIEHYWGYTKCGENRTDEYKVEHPKWELFETNYAEVDVDFGKVYGQEFSFLSKQKPASILLANNKSWTNFLLRFFSLKI